MPPGVEVEIAAVPKCFAPGRLSTERRRADFLVLVRRFVWLQPVVRCLRFEARRWIQSEACGAATVISMMGKARTAAGRPRSRRQRVIGPAIAHCTRGRKPRRLTASGARCYERTLILGPDESRNSLAQGARWQRGSASLDAPMAGSPCRRMFCNVKRRKMQSSYAVLA